MGNPLDWRRIETELENISRSFGYELDTTEGLDKIIVFNHDNVNLTQVAKELADRLGSKAS